MKTYNIDQKTDEWKELRKGKITASRFSELIWKRGDTLTETGKSYIKELIAEKYNLNNYKEKDIYNEDIERGEVLEPECRQEYADLNNVEINLVGFVERDEYTGCSPDGLIGEDGLIECKAPKNKNFIKYILGDEKDYENYVWQCKYQMYITGRKWCDLCFYNKNFKKHLYIKRITLTEEDRNIIEKTLSESIKIYKEYEEQLKEYV